MARRPLPRILERPIYYKDEAERRATLSDRWRLLCDHEGVYISRAVYDLNSETLLDAIAREPAAARAMLTALASRAIPAFRDPAKRRPPGAKSRTKIHNEIAARFIEIETEHPEKSETQICGAVLRAMKKDSPATLAAAQITTAEGIRSAVRNAIRKSAEMADLNQRVVASHERRSHMSLLADAEPGVLRVGQITSFVKLIPKGPLAKRERRKKVRR